MAADLHIHLLAEDASQQGMTEEDLPVFFGSTLGSKYFTGLGWQYPFSAKEPLYEKTSHDDNIWIGEVSWLKAALFEDAETFVPDAVGAISEIIGEDLPVIDDELIAQVDEALKLKNTTSYSLANAQEILDWLNQHKGRRAYTISW
jgi:hypothetical protein